MCLACRRPSGTSRPCPTEMGRQDYADNYDRIAADHLEHWRAMKASPYQTNPWQTDEQVEATSASTAALVEKYSRPGDSVLDAGCGMGELLSRVHDRRLFGCDLARAYLQVARRRGIDAIYAELEDLPYEAGQFDVVTATDVLEHVLDLNRVVGEMLRVLRPGGVLICRTPNNEDLSQYVDPDYPYRFVHLRSWQEPGLRLLFTRIFDCEVEECGLVFDGIEINVVVRKPAPA